MKLISNNNTIKIDTDPINLKIKGIIGICYDVCVPIEFETQSGLKTVSRDINTDLLAALANLHFHLLILVKTTHAVI